MNFYRKHETVSAGNRLVSICAALAVSGILVLPGRGSAAIVNLSNGDSTATVNLDSSAGMSSWTVNGQNQLAQQWFWFRIGNSGLAQPINTISSANILLQDPNTVSAEYTSALLGITLDITYTLTGGGPGNADISEQIEIINNNVSQLDFHFFQYSDFNLLNTPGGDSVSISGNPTDGYDFALQTKGPTQIAEAVTAPPANEAEAGLTPDTLNSLNTVSGYNLNGTVSIGPGDATWALQWDATIDGNGGMFDLTKDKKLSISIIPEPSTIAVVALGLGAVRLVRRRQSS